MTVLVSVGVGSVGAWLAPSLHLETLAVRHLWSARWALTPAGCQSDL